MDYGQLANCILWAMLMMIVPVIGAGILWLSNKYNRRD